MLAVTILGNNSAVPAHNRHPTSQVIQTYDHKFLVDCGEGTQMQMTAYKIKPGKINHIFISHLHGDHYFGLIGLLTSLGLNSRKTEMNIYSPKGLKEIIGMQFEVANAHLPYPINFHVLNEEKIVFEDKKIEIECFKVNHRIECWGFIFREKKNMRRLNPSAITKHEIPISCYEMLQEGKDYISPGNTIIKNEELTKEGPYTFSYAFCADTGYFENIIGKIKNVDLLYHESTYLDALEEKAIARFHSTAKQAATVAKKANVKKLLLGHFSSMYEDVSDFQKEASEVFKNTECAQEGVCYMA